MATPQQLAAFNYSVPGALAWNPVKSTSFTAVAGNAYPVNTTSAAITVTLPASPSAGAIVQLTDYAGTWATNNVTVAPNGSKINGAAANYTLNIYRQSVAFVYVDATQGWVVYSAFNISNIVSGTAVSTTSGTAVDFTSIPSWVKRITVMLNGVSTNGASLIQIQIGNTTVTTSGYSSTTQQTGQASDFQFSSTGFLTGGGNASISRSGIMVLANLSGNIWVESHNVYGVIPTGNYYQITGAGIVSLSSKLNILRVTAVNGTDAFDAGSVNILYE